MHNESYNFDTHSLVVLKKVIKEKEKRNRKILNSLFNVVEQENRKRENNYLC